MFANSPHNLNVVFIQNLHGPLHVFHTVDQIREVLKPWPGVPGQVIDLAGVLRYLRQCQIVVIGARSQKHHLVTDPVGDLQP